MTSAIEDLLLETGNHPILVDIGSSGSPPDIWEAIAKHSIYIGFDPDLREIYQPSDGYFYKSTIVNKAITNDESISESSFYLTQSPYSSSTLKPNSASLENFIFSDLFVPQKETQVSVTTLNSVLEDLSIKKIDCFKIDTQGTDLRIFNSISENIRSHILSVDIEPGLIDAYIGEDLFVDAHKDLVSQGFWLSNLNVCGSVRVKRSTVEKLNDIDKDINFNSLQSFHRLTPGWCEARYLRTIDWLTHNQFEKTDYVLIWILSIIDEQFGFSVELVFEYERIFGKDQFSQIMLHESILKIKQLKQNHNQRKLRTALGQIIPTQIKQWLKK